MLDPVLCFTFDDAKDVIQSNTTYNITLMFFKQLLLIAFLKSYQSVLNVMWQLPQEAIARLQYNYHRKQ